MLQDLPFEDGLIRKQHANKLLLQIRQQEHQPANSILHVSGEYFST